MFKTRFGDAEKAYYMEKGIDPPNITTHWLLTQLDKVILSRVKIIVLFVVLLYLSKHNNYFVTKQTTIFFLPNSTFPIAKGK